MTNASGIGKFYGAAIHLLRWWVRRWKREDVAADAGISVATLDNYERGKTVPGPERRQRIAAVLEVSPADLDSLAGAVRTALSDLQAPGAERLADKVTADLAADFHRAVLPLVARLVASPTSEPPAAGGEEEIRALAPLLDRLSPQDLQDLVDKLPSLRRWAFVNLVGEESARAATVDAKRALELARFTLWVAERVSGEEAWASLVFGWAVLGNARRVEGDLAEALEAFARSARLQAERPEGGAELFEPWRLLDLEASLRIDLRQLPEALRLLDQAAEVAPWTGPTRAHLLCIRSIALDRMGDPQGSVVALREALSQIDPKAEPRLFCMLQFNLADTLTSVGQAAEAAEMLPALRRMQAQVGNGLNQIRLRWLEGKIDAGLGRLDRAIEALSWVRAAFAGEDLRYDEAQAGMDLAGLYLKQGRTSEVKRLVLQMAPVFKANGVHAEARKALDLFRRAVEKEAATPELAGRLAGYLRRAQHDPEMRFEAAA